MDAVIFVSKVTHCNVNAQKTKQNDIPSLLQNRKFAGVAPRPDIWAILEGYSRGAIGGDALRKALCRTSSVHLFCVKLFDGMGGFVHRDVWRWQTRHVAMPKTMRRVFKFCLSLFNYGVLLVSLRLIEPKILT